MKTFGFYKLPISKELSLIQKKILKEIVNAFTIFLFQNAVLNLTFTRIYSKSRSVTKNRDESGIT